MTELWIYHSSEYASGSEYAKVQNMPGLHRVLNMQPLKQPLLDVKWENYDINVVQQAYIPKFSKLDNIGMPLRLFESFFDDALVDEVVDYTKL